MRLRRNHWRRKIRASGFRQPAPMNGRFRGRAISLQAADLGRKLPRRYPGALSALSRGARANGLVAFGQFRPSSPSLRKHLSVSKYDAVQFQPFRNQDVQFIRKDARRRHLGDQPRNIVAGGDVDAGLGVPCGEDDDRVLDHCCTPGVARDHGKQPKRMQSCRWGSPG